MKARIALGMAMSFALGALAVQALHAQGKPPIYYIAEVDVTDLEGYVKEFAPKAAASAEAYGGRTLAASQKVTAKAITANTSTSGRTAFAHSGAIPYRGR